MHAMCCAFTSTLGQFSDFCRLSLTFFCLFMMSDQNDEKNPRVITVES